MDQNAKVIANAINGSLNIIEQDREKEIVSRRFGLSGNKETLEQIGDMLSITRERVRQLEKAILIRLRISAEDGNIPELAQAEKIIVRNLTEMGRIAKVSELAEKIFGKDVKEKERSMLAFIGVVSPSLKKMTSITTPLVSLTMVMKKKLNKKLTKSLNSSKTISLQCQLMNLTII